MRELSADTEALWRAVEVAHTGGSDQARLMAMLLQLARVAPEQSEAWAYAHRELAALLVGRDPWRASIFARKVLDHAPTDAMAWGIVGLAQSMLGNHKFAVQAYRRACRHDPTNPWYAHNLGHMLDVIFDRPSEAVPLLEHALEKLAEWPEASGRHHLEATASLAHALMRSGQLGPALAHARRVVRSGSAGHAHHELYRVLREQLEDWLCEEIRLQDPEGTTKRRVLRRRHTLPTADAGEVVRATD